MTRNGSLVDARNGGAGDDLANILANTIDLKAVNGSIGATNGLNDLEMNSGWQHTSTIAAEATESIFLTETAGAANVVLLEAQRGDIRFTVRESALAGEDLNLLLNGSTLVDETTGADPTHELLAHGAVRPHRGARRLDQPPRRRQRDDAAELADPRGRVDRHLRRLPPCHRRVEHLRRLRPGCRLDGARPDRHGRSRRRHGHEPPRRDHAGAALEPPQLHHADLRQLRRRHVQLLVDLPRRQDARVRLEHADQLPRRSRPDRAASTPRTPTTASTTSSSTSCRR